MKISIIVEGATEKAFVPYLRDFLRPRLAGSMPNLDIAPENGRIPTHDKLGRKVEFLLTGRNAADHVIALTDVYTGSHPPDFADADDAKAKMRQWVGSEPRFHPHAAQYDFEAWLIPYWDSIRRVAKSDRRRLAKNPEMINHLTPPAHLLKQVFGKDRKYIKTRDARAILRGNDLSVAIQECSELKALVNTILTVSGGERIA